MTQELFEAAQRRLPGGVNSPVRAYHAVGGAPLFISRAAGAHLYDSRGRRYIDYVGSWGPMILGHAHPEVTAALREALEKGASFGAPTEIETRMAETVYALMPSMEKVRMVNSGTEAAMSAIRLARAHTGRDVIVKFEGCYHGHADSLLVKAGSGALTLGVPTSPGVPAELARLTVTLDYNDAEQVTRIFDEIGRRVAGVIVEPVAGNMGCVPARADFLTALRNVCDRHGALLIFDEVMTGFRVALGGAQSVYGVSPDLTCLGKIIGGGLPVGAFGGRAAIMDQLAPDGPVYQAGTLSGNPLAMSAGLTTLRLLQAPDCYTRLERVTRALTQGLSDAARRFRVPLICNQVGGMFGLFFTAADAVDNFAQVTACDADYFKYFFHAMLEDGVYLAPSPFEAGFVSLAHDDEDIEHTITAAERAFQARAP